MDYRITTVDGDELYHYGVKGMKWGKPKKTVEEKFKEASDKFDELGDKADKTQNRANDRFITAHEWRSGFLQNKAISNFYDWRGNSIQQKANRQMKKAVKFMSKMEKKYGKKGYHFNTEQKKRAQNYVDRILIASKK